MQHNEAFTMTCAIRGASKQKISQELEKKFFQQRRLFIFFKNFKKESLSYLFNTNPKSNRNYQSRKWENIPQIRISRDFFKNLFFWSVISEWYKLDEHICNTFQSFNQKLWNLLNLFQIVSLTAVIPKRVKLLTRLRLGLSYLCKHTF